MRTNVMLLPQEFGMFKYQPQTRNFWFSHLSIELQSEYKLVGSVLGLAIYNGVILDLHFPPVVYKKLLGGKPDFQVSVFWPRHAANNPALQPDLTQDNVNGLWLCNRCTYCLLLAILQAARLTINILPVTYC